MSECSNEVFYSILTIDVHFTVILFAAYSLRFPFLIFLTKREILENLRQYFDNRTINLIGKPVGEAIRI